MEEKKTIGEVITENKGKIVKIGLVVVGITVGAFIVLKVKNGKAVETIEAITDDATTAISTAVEAATK